MKFSFFHLFFAESYRLLRVESGERTCDSLCLKCTWSKLKSYTADKSYVYYTLHVCVGLAALSYNKNKKRVTPRKWQKRVWVWCLRVVVLGLSNPADSYFLAWWLLQQLLRRKVFTRFKRIKTELKGRNVPRDVAQCPHSGPAFSRLDRLLPIGPRAEGGPALHVRKLTLCIEAVCVVPARGPQYFQNVGPDVDENQSEIRRC